MGERGLGSGRGCCCMLHDSIVSSVKGTQAYWASSVHCIDRRAASLLSAKLHQLPCVRSRKRIRFTTSQRNTFFPPSIPFLNTEKYTICRI